MTEQLDERPSEDAPKKPSFREELKTQWNGFTRAKKIGVVAVTSVGLLVMMSMCAAPDSKKDDKAPAASTSTSVAAPASETAKAAEPETPKPPHDATAAVMGDGSVDITFDIGDNFTHNMIVRKAQGDTVDLLKWAKENYPAASEVVITGRFPMTDQFGNTATDEILIVAYTRATLDKINFGGVNRENIWTLADRRYVHPELRVN